MRNGMPMRCGSPHRENSEAIVLVVNPCEARVMISRTDCMTTLRSPCWYKARSPELIQLPGRRTAWNQAAGRSAPRSAPGKVSPGSLGARARMGQRDCLDAARRHYRFAEDEGMAKALAFGVNRP